MKKLVSPVTMFLFGIIAFAAIMIVTNRLGIGIDNPKFWPYRVLTALAAASISISIPGMLKVDYTPKGDGVRTFNDIDDQPVQMTLLEKEPTVSASGAIAVFVLVYLFNPLV